MIMSTVAMPEQGDQWHLSLFIVDFMVARSHNRTQPVDPAIRVRYAYGSIHGFEAGRRRCYGAQCR
jgi:hypothetical protein